MPAGKLSLVARGRTPKTTKAVDAGIRREIRKEALKVVKKQSETKNTTFGEENVQLFHHVPYFHRNMLYSLNGDRAGDRPGFWNIRVGDELYLQRMNLKLWLSNKQDRPNVIYRVIVFWYESDKALTDVLVLNKANNMLLNAPNRESISVIADKIIRNVGDSQSGREHSLVRFINKSWKNKKIIYDDHDNDSPYVPKFRDIGFMVLAYDAFGTLTTDNIASFAYQYDMAFKEN